MEEVKVVLGKWTDRIIKIETRNTIPRFSTQRRQQSPEFKAKVALEALKGVEPVHAIAAKCQIHPGTGESMAEVPFGAPP